MTLAPSEVCAAALFKGLRWPLDDALAAEIEPGRVMKLEIVVRFGEVWEYVNGRRSWRTDVLEIGVLQGPERIVRGRPSAHRPGSSI